MEYIIREMKASEYNLLDIFLYGAIFQRSGDKSLPLDIIEEEHLQVYIKDFGCMADDHCLCAEVNGSIVGAVWVRNIDGFGSIDNETPEFAISIHKEYRKYGIGMALMKEMLQTLKHRGYKKASLAVQKDNYALNLYKKVGFKIIDENEEEYIMVWYS